jgi:putative intracellular protease/amidase
MNRTMRIGLLLFDDVDLLDVGGPYEVFLTASRLAVRDGDPPPFEVWTIGMGRAPVKSYGGMGLIPTHTFDQIDELDVAIIPGAIAIDRVIADERIMRSAEWLADRSLVTASVCTGAFVLGRLGLLDGLAWTTHFEDIAELARIVGTAGGSVAPWVDQGDIVTAGGLSSGIAMALHLVDRFAGRTLAVRTARQLQYEWTPDAGGPSHSVLAMLWAGEGGRSALHDYERRLRPLVEEHGGALEVILQPEGSDGWDGDPPDEIHVLSFGDHASWNAFRTDPRRSDLEVHRAAAVGRTIVFTGRRLATLE